MTAEEFRAWRKGQALTQDEAARTLGITKKTIGRYEAAEAKIPLAVELACAAIDAGLEPYDGSSGAEGAMTADALRAWREIHGFTQVEAGRALGLGRQTINKYEARVDAKSRKAPIPRTVALACAAIDADLHKPR